MNKVWNDVIQETLIVRNNDDCILGTLKLVDSSRHYAQGINIQTGIRFIQDCEPRLKDGHLQNLISFLFAA